MLNNADAWYPAIDAGGGIRDGAWVAEATDLVDLAAWPAGTRLILRKERPHPGAQLTFTDTDGHRITGFITDTGDGACPANSPGWNCGIANTPASRTGSAKPKPPACVTCPSTLFRPTPPGSKSSWPPPIWSPGPNSSASPTTPSWPAAKSTPSATASARRRPHHPRRPTNPAAHRRHLALGHAIATAWQTIRAAFT